MAKTIVPFFSRGYVSNFRKPSFILQLAIKEDNEPVYIRQGVEAVMVSITEARQFVKQNYSSSPYGEQLVSQLEQLSVATVESPDKMNYLNDLFEVAARLQATQSHWLEVFNTRCPDWKTWQKLPYHLQSTLSNQILPA